MIHKSEFFLVIGFVESSYSVWYYVTWDVCDKFGTNDFRFVIEWQFIA